MNLGVIYLYTFFVIVFGSLLVSTVLAYACSVFSRQIFRKKFPGSSILFLSFLIWILSTAPLLTLLHEPIFVSWHKAQNKWVPNVPCLEYRPMVTRLFASYSMTREEFDTWANQHPWGLEPVPVKDVRPYDLEQFGMESVDAAYASEMANNGKHLLALHRDGIAYIAYYAN